MEAPEEMRKLANAHEERQKKFCLQRFLELIRYTADQRGWLAVRIDRKDIYQVGYYSDDQIFYALGELAAAGYAITHRKQWGSIETIRISWDVPA